MDQSKCNVPNLGTQSSFSKPLEQGITGVLEHCHDKNRVTFYRTFGNVGKGANLTIYCILASIEDFRRRHKKNPEELFVQCDGKER